MARTIDNIDLAIGCSVLVCGPAARNDVIGRYGHVEMVARSDVDPSGAIFTISLMPLVDTDTRRHVVKLREYQFIVLTDEEVALLTSDRAYHTRDICIELLRIYVNAHLIVYKELRTEYRQVLGPVQSCEACD